MIGEDTTERLDVIPVQFRVIVTKPPKLTCRACPGTVVQALARLIEGGMPTDTMVTHVLVSRYADHQPLYRQAQILAWPRRHHRTDHPVLLDGLRDSRSRRGGDAAA
jgi:transposase